MFYQYFNKKTGKVESSTPSSSSSTSSSNTATKTAPSSSSSSFSAPVLYGPGGQVANPTSSTTQDQVNAALKAGWSTTAPNGMKTPNPAVNTSINAGDLGKVKPMGLPTNLPNDYLNNANALVNSLAFPTEPSTEEKNLNENQDLYKSLVNRLSKKSKDAERLTEQYKVPEFTRQLQDTNMLIAQRTNAYKQMYETAENKAVPTPFIVGEQAQVQRQSAIELGALAATAQALQGNINLAFDTIDRTLALKYEPIEAEIGYVKDAISMNYNDLTRADKKRADQLNIALSERSTYVNELKDAQKAALTAIYNSDKPDADKQKAAADVWKATTPSDASIVGVRFGGTSDLDKRYKEAQIANLYSLADDRKASDQVINRISKLNINSPTYFTDLLASSSGGSKLTGEQTKPIAKALTVVGQIDTLADSLKGVDTGPLIGIIKSKNPYDVKAQAINAQLQALVPGLARGVYGEVGVLTDQDIANYAKTIGNLRSPQELNNLLLSMTLKTIKSGIADQLEVFASAGRDVSGFGNLYSRLDTRINAIDASLGITDENANIGSKIETAVQSGYSPSQIINQISASLPDLATQIQQAFDSGYTEDEVLNYLKTK